MSGGDGGAFLIRHEGGLAAISARRQRRVDTGAVSAAAGVAAARCGAASRQRLP